MKKVFELPCMDGRKSFYGKARVTEYADGRKVLTSYCTDVCMIDVNGVFRRLWDGESMTTTRHINSFLQFYHLDGGGAAWWRKQPVTETEQRPGPDMTPEQSYKAMIARRYAG